MGLSAGVFFIKALNHIQDVSVCSSNEITQTTHPQFGFRRASAARPKSSAEPEQSSPLLLQLSAQQCGQNVPFMSWTCPGKAPGTGDGITLGLGAGADSSLGCLAEAAAAAAAAASGESRQKGLETSSRDQPRILGVWLQTGCT